MLIMDEFDKLLTENLPYIRNFSKSLTGDHVKGEDLCSEAVIRLLRNRDKFVLGTNFRAWASVVVRNHFLSDKRKAWRNVELDQEVAERTLMFENDPTWKMELEEVIDAMKYLPDDQREALQLVVFDGFSYEDAAELANCEVGTMKSRVSRGRSTLIEFFGA